MIFAFLIGAELHAVHCIAKAGLASVGATALCTATGDGGGGIYQVPTWAFDGRATYNAKLAVCKKCGEQVQTMQKPPAP